MFLKQAAVVLLLFGAGTGLAQPDPKKPEPLVTRTYDLKKILGDRSPSSGMADTDAVIKLILETLPVGELKPGAGGPQLIERENSRLEVRATEKLQGEVKDLIEALQHLADLAVDIKADVIELDPAAFEKFRKTLPKATKGRPDSPAVVFGSEEEPTLEELKAIAEANKVLGAGRVVQTSTARYANGVEATVSARRSTFTHQTLPVAAKKAAGTTVAGKEGFKLLALPVVSGDRRFIRLKLTEQSAALVGMTKRNLAEIGGEKLVLASPVVEDFGKAGTGVVSDGGTILFRLSYAPKDKVWVVVLRPKIFIQAEGDALKKQERSGK